MYNLIAPATDSHLKKSLFSRGESRTMKIHKSKNPCRFGLAALYLGAMWLSLDVKVADTADVTTQRARRSPGRRASRPVVEGWEAAEVTQLWLAESPAADGFTHSRSSDPTMKEREHDKRWSRECERTMGTGRQWSRRVQRWNESDWCVEIVKEKLWAQETQEVMFLSISFTVVHLFFFWGLSTSSDKRHKDVGGWLNFLC